MENRLSFKTIKQFFKGSKIRKLVDCTSKNINLEDMYIDYQGHRGRITSIDHRLNKINVINDLNWDLPQTITLDKNHIVRIGYKAIDPEHLLVFGPFRRLIKNTCRWIKPWLPQAVWALGLVTIYFTPTILRELQTYPYLKDIAVNLLTILRELQTYPYLKDIAVNLYASAIFGIFIYYTITPRIKRWEEDRIKKNEIKQLKESIEEYRNWDTEIATRRITGTIKRLSELKAEKIDLRDCFLGALQLNGITSNYQGEPIENSRENYLQKVQLGPIQDNTERELSYTKWRLENVNLDESDIHYIKWDNSVFLSCSFKASRINHTNFNKISFNEYSSDKQDAIENNSDNDTINRCHFEKSAITDSTFIGCHLEFSNFQAAYLHTVTFTYCQLHNASFQNAKLTNVTFADCNLMNINFNNTLFQNVTFTLT